MIVIFGTVASVNAYSSFAPWRMMPPHSWSVPGRKPGTSQNVSSGMLNASQVRTKRAALALASMSSTPASWLRLVADDADRVAVQAREAADDVLGVVLVDLEELAVVDDQPHDVAHVVGLVRVVGTTWSSSSSIRSGSSDGMTRGGVSRLFCGRKLKR
jgi:hypothetical protein